MSFFDALEETAEAILSPVAGGKVAGVEIPPTAPPRIVRICLMVCGHFTKKLKDENGDYREMYYKWLIASLPKHSNVKLELDAFEAKDEEYPKRNKIDEYDAVLVSGSRMCFFMFFFCWDESR